MSKKKIKFHSKLLNKEITVVINSSLRPQHNELSINKLAKANKLLSELKEFPGK